MAPLGTTLPGNMIPLASQAGIQALLAGELPVAADSWARFVSTARPRCETEGGGRGRPARDTFGWCQETRQRMRDRHTRRASPRGGRERQRDKAHVRRLLQWSQTVRLDWEGLVGGAWGPAGSGSAAAAAAAPAGRRPAAGSCCSEAGAGGTADTKSQESSSVFILGAESEGRGGEGRAGVP